MARDIRTGTRNRVKIVEILNPPINAVPIPRYSSVPAPSPNASGIIPKTLENYSNSSLLEVKLYTGRFHQIRAQFAFIGHPISGDKKYGAATTLPDKQIALYAHQLIFKHPITKEEVCVESPPPTYWPIR